MQSKTTTVDAYLKELPAERREALSAIRAVILKNLDANVEEGMQYGMIGYYIPHRIFPAGYHCDPKQPLPFAALASQKQHISLYLMSAYSMPGEQRWIAVEFAKSGKKLDMGKSCIRFKSLADVPLDVIGAAIKRITAAAYIARYQHLLGSLKGGGTKAVNDSPSKASAATKGASKVAKKSTKKKVKKTAKKIARKSAK